MTMLTLPPLKKTPLLSFRGDSESPTVRKPLLLVVTADEPFWRALLKASPGGDRRLIRRQDANQTARHLELFRPGVVLLDLDPPSAWEVADLLLLHGNSPPILLLTSRGDQIDFKTAIEAGCLIDKSVEPATVLALAALALDASDRARHERNAMRHSVLRQLKPCAWSAQDIPLGRFWGINK